MALKVGFASYDWSQTILGSDGHPMVGGAGWYRMMLPMRWLRDHGHDCAIGTLTYDTKAHLFAVLDWDGIAFYPDIVVMQRYMHEGLVECMDPAKARGQIVVNDLDDWFFGIDPRNHAFHTSDPKLNAEVNRDHYAAVLAKSNAITVSTPFLRDQCRKLFPRARVHLLRNAIDLERWHPREEGGDPPVIGWVGAAPWRSGDLSTEGARATGEFCNRHNLRFHHSGMTGIGPHYFQREQLGILTERERAQAREWFSSAGEQIGARYHTEQPMASIEDYPMLFDEIDVGIVPLADVPFNHAKSAIKAMEYAASGIPFVAQALPEQCGLLGTFDFGRVAKNRSSWTRELEKMLSPAWREGQREQGLVGIKALDIANRGVQWQEFYESL